MSGIYNPGSGGTALPPPTPPGAVVGNGLISGGAVYRVGTTGLNFTVTAATYAINSVQLASPETNLNLAAADPTFARIDVFALNSSGAAIVVTGTPAASPVVPSIDPLSQLQVGMILVKAAATSADVTSTFMYQEDAEWVATVSGAINKASTTNPYAGTKCIQATAAAAGSYFNLANGSVFDTSTRNMLFLEVRPGVWPGAKSIALQWFSGTNARGSPVTLKNGAYNLDTSLTAGYQLIGIPMAAFGVAGVAVDSFRGTTVGGGSGLSYNIDNIIMQGGMAPPAPSDYLRWKGLYNSTVQYVYNDVTSQANGLYVARATLQGIAPPAAGWELMVGPGATQTLTDGATINWNAAIGEVAKVTLAGNRTMAAPTNLVDGGTYILRISQDATGSRTITWNSVFKWPAATAPTLTTTANALDIITFTSDGTNLYCVGQLAFG